MKANSILITTLLLLGTSMLATAAPKGGGKGKPQGPPPVPPEILALYDTDGDGKLSETEKAAMKADQEARRAELIAKYDTDGDGKLSAAEALPLKQAIQQRIAGGQDAE